MNLQHDYKFFSESIDGLSPHCEELALDLAKEYHEHMQRLIPASEWHDDDGDVLWYRLPVTESPYVGSPLDVGWDTEPFAILLNGETRGEYFTHFQVIHTPT